MFIRRGLYLNQDGGAGGTGGSPTAAAAAPPASAGAAPPVAPSGGAPSAFDWSTAGLQPEHLTLVQERGWKAPGDVLTSYRNLEGAVGVPPERLIKLPAQRDAGDPKVWNDVFTKLGKPASPDKYNLPLPPGDKGEFAKVASQWFHSANLTQSQAEAVTKAWNEYTAAAAKNAQTESETKAHESVTQLKQAWGSEYEANAALVDKAAEEFGMTQEQLNALKQVMGPKDAMTFLHNIGKKLGVEGAPKGIGDGAGAGGFAQMTPAQAIAELTALKRDPMFAKMFNSEDPKQRQEARQKIERLNRLAAPGVSPVSNAY